MAVFTVHMPRSGEAERAIFLRDGFSIGAFLFGPLWLFFRGAWMSGSALLVAILIGFSVLSAYGIQAGYLVALSFLMMLLLGFEGPSLARLDLKLRGYHLAGVVTGNKPEDAEARFFASHLAANASPLPTPPGSGNLQGLQLHQGIIGSFPWPSGQLPPGGSRTGS